MSLRPERREVAPCKSAHPPLPPLPPLHRLAAEQPVPVPTDVNLVNFFNPKDWERLSINDPGDPHFEEKTPDNNVGLVHGEPSPWEVGNAVLFPPLGKEYANFGAPTLAGFRAKLKVQDQGNVARVAEQNNPKFYAELQNEANKHFKKVEMRSATQKLRTMPSWTEQSTHRFYLKLPPGSASPPKLIKVTTVHCIGYQKLANVGDSEDLFQFTVSLPAFADWSQKEVDQYGISDPSNTLTPKSNKWEKDFNAYKFLDTDLLKYNDPLIQVADNLSVDSLVTEDDDDDDDIAKNTALYVGLWFQGGVQIGGTGPFVPAAFPVCARAPPASRKIGFLRVFVSVVQDRSASEAAYSSDTYSMKFPVKHDWTVTDGWRPQQLGFLRECLSKFPVFELSELTDHLGGLYLRTVDGEVFERFREYRGSASSAPPGTAQRKRARPGGSGDEKSFPDASNDAMQP